MKRHGYTLIEMLIALVLVVTLMSAAWGLTSLYNRFLTAGRAQAMDQQIARSLFQLIEDDIGLVSLQVRPPQSLIGESSTIDLENDQTTARDKFSFLSGSFFETADAADSGSEVGRSSTDGSDSANGDFGLFSGFMNTLADQNLNLPPLEFTGTASELRVTFLSPADSPRSAGIGLGQTLPAVSGQLSAGPGAAAGDQTDLQPNANRLVTVVYQFEAPGMARDLDRRLPSGLHRIEVPTLQLRQLTTSSRFEPQRSDTTEIDRFTLEALLTPVPVANQQLIDENEVVVPPLHEHIGEVVHFELEYFDGAAWLSSWNSADALPTAIRVRFGLASQDELVTIAGVFADAATQPQLATASSANKFVDPLATITPRRFEQILVLSSDDPPDVTSIDNDEFMRGAP